MKNEYLKRLFILIFVVFIYLVSIRYLLSFYIENTKDYVSFFIQTIIKLPLVALTIFMIKKEKIFNIKILFRNNTVSILICALLLYLSLHQAFQKIIEHQLVISNYNVYSYFIQCLTTGFFEELFFRVLIFGYVCYAYQNNSSENYYKQTIITSFLFAIVHLTGIFTKNIDTISVLNQIMFAFLIGVLLQSIFFRINNIILNSIIHGLINFNGMLNQKLLNIPSVEPESTALDDLKQSLVTFILLGIFVVLPIFYFSFKKKENKLINFK